MNEETQQHPEEKAAPRAQSCICAGTGPTFTRMIEAIAPAEATEHFRAARIEMLKGIRALIDHRIEALSQPLERKGTKVTVE